MYDRPSDTAAIRGLLREFPAVALLGARQVGKTTLARAIVAARRGKTSFFDLEHEPDAARLKEPGIALRSLKGLVVIDEVQAHPVIFAALRPLVDRRPLTARFLLLGSASPELVARGAESLAGRIGFHELGGLSIEDLGAADGLDAWHRLWLRGGFPRSLLAANDESSLRWRQAFVRTFLERDLGQMGIGLPATTMRRFWSMLAHWHGQRWNASEFARNFGVSDMTVRRYLGALVGTFVMRVLRPWHESIAKRQVKSPKVYIADPGLLHALLNIETRHELLGHAKMGASFEGFVIDEVVRATGATAHEVYYWATQQGAELDLLLVRGTRRIGVEVKFTEKPAVTPSMRSALEDLRLEKLFVVHAGDESFPLAERVEAIPVTAIWTPRMKRILDRGVK